MAARRNEGPMIIFPMMQLILLEIGELWKHSTKTPCNTILGHRHNN